MFNDIMPTKPELVPPPAWVGCRVGCTLPDGVPSQAPGAIRAVPDQAPVKQHADRNDGGKLPIHLIPPEFIEQLAAIFDYGQRKYAPNNWAKGMEYSRMYSSAMRHMLAFWNGNDIDDESGMYHLAHAAWNCLALLWYTEHLEDELDDRGYEI